MVTKRYLTSEEINYIVSACTKLYPDVASMKFVELGVVAQLVMDDEEVKNAGTVNDIYDYLVSNSINLYDYIDNLKLVDELIKDSVSMDVQINILLDKVSKSIDELKLGDTLKELVEAKKPKTTKKTTKKTAE